jgi:hypothetical protein
MIRGPVNVLPDPAKMTFPIAREMEELPMVNVPEPVRAPEIVKVVPLSAARFPEDDTSIGTVLERVEVLVAKKVPPSRDISLEDPICNPSLIESIPS